jgi:hypothetical protein
MALQSSETRDALCSTLAGLVEDGCDWACGCGNGSRGSNQRECGFLESEDERGRREERAGVQ